jgi:hypothetical protein
MDQGCIPSRAENTAEKIAKVKRRFYVGLSGQKGEVHLPTRASPKLSAGATITTARLPFYETFRGGFALEQNSAGYPRTHGNALSWSRANNPTDGMTRTRQPSRWCCSVRWKTHALPQTAIRPQAAISREPWTMSEILAVCSGRGLAASRVLLNSPL